MLSVSSLFFKQIQTFTGIVETVISLESAFVCVAAILPIDIEVKPLQNFHLILRFDSLVRPISCSSFMIALERLQ